MTMPVQVALVAAKEEQTELRSPLMGRFTAAVAVGTVVQGGTLLGHLRQLRNAYPIVAPDGITGRVVSVARPGYDACYGEAVVTIAAFEGGVVSAANAGDATVATVAVAAPLDGQFYLRPSPEAPPFVAAGQTVEPGATIGLIEVMKFYYPVRYEGTESFVAGDYLLPNASPVSAGQGLLARA